MTSRFASISDEEVKEFTEKLETENTKKKTLYDIKGFKLYLDVFTRKYFCIVSTFVLFAMKPSRICKT